MSYKQIVLIILCITQYSCTQSEKYPQKIRLKCIPFSVESPIPMSEFTFIDSVDFAPNPFMEVKEITAKDKIKTVMEVINEVTNKKGKQLSYYDLRACIELENSKDKYYIDIRKEYIIYKELGYKINKEKFEKLSDAIGMCKEYPTIPKAR